MHGGGHVRDPRAPQGGHREGLPGRDQQGDQGVRQVLLHAALHDLQLIVSAMAARSRAETALLSLLAPRLSLTLAFSGCSSFE